jgi:hypothetical protein
MDANRWWWFWFRKNDVNNSLVAVEKIRSFEPIKKVIIKENDVKEMSVEENNNK